MVRSSSSSSLLALRLLETGGCRRWTTTAWIYCLPTNESRTSTSSSSVATFDCFGRKKASYLHRLASIGIAYRLLAAPAGSSSCRCCCRRMMIDDAAFLSCCWNCNGAIRFIPETLSHILAAAADASSSSWSQRSMTIGE
jgi:hypothetical protein